jgi:hypothetical protein
MVIACSSAATLAFRDPSGQRVDADKDSRNVKLAANRFFVSVLYSHNK